MSVILLQTRKLEDVSPDGAVDLPRTGGPDHPLPSCLTALLQTEDAL